MNVYESLLQRVISFSGLRLPLDLRSAACLLSLQHGAELLFVLNCRLFAAGQCESREYDS